MVEGGSLDTGEDVEIFTEGVLSLLGVAQT